MEGAGLSGGNGPESLQVRGTLELAVDGIRAADKDRRRRAEGIQIFGDAVAPPDIQPAADEFHDAEPSSDLLPVNFSQLRLGEPQRRVGHFRAPGKEAGQDSGHVMGSVVQIGEDHAPEAPSRGGKGLLFRLRISVTAESFLDIRRRGRRPGRADVP